MIDARGSPRPCTSAGWKCRLMLDSGSSLSSTGESVSFFVMMHKFDFANSIGKEN